MDFFSMSRCVTKKILCVWLRGAERGWKQLKFSNCDVTSEIRDSNYINKNWRNLKRHRFAWKLGNFPRARKTTINKSFLPKWKFQVFILKHQEKLTLVKIKLVTSREVTWKSARRGKLVAECIQVIAVIVGRGKGLESVYCINKERN